MPVRARPHLANERPDQSLRDRVKETEVDKAEAIVAMRPAGFLPDRLAVHGCICAQKIARPHHGLPTERHRKGPPRTLANVRRTDVGLDAEGATCEVIRGCYGTPQLQATHQQWTGTRSGRPFLVPFDRMAAGKVVVG